MPVIQVKALPQNPAVDVQDVLKKVCLNVAELMDLPKEHVWGVWEGIDPAHYMEGDVPKYEQPKSTHPPLVRLEMYHGRGPEIVEAVLCCIADTMVRELQLEAGNVFIRYQEVQAGTVYSAGKVEKA